MGLLFCDGCDAHANIAQAMRKWYGQVSTTFSTTTGRWGGGALYTGRYSYLLTCGFTPAKTIIFQVAFKPNASVWADNNNGKVVRLENQDQTALHLYFNGDNAGNIQVKRGDSAVMGTSAGAAMKVNQWNYLEAKVTIDNSAGVIVLKLNGVEVLNLTGIDTQNGGTDDLGFVKLSGGYSSGPGNWWDDMIVMDTAGSEFNDFIGDTRITAISPDGDTADADWTKSGGATNYENVDDATPDDDTTYVESGTVTDKDIYDHGALGISPDTVKGVVVNVLGKDISAGTRGVKLVCKSGTTEEQSPDELTLGGDYGTVQEGWEKNPDNDADWNETTVNAAKFGMELTT